MSFFNDSSSSHDPVKVERLLSTAPTPGKKRAYGFDPASSTEDLQEHEKWSELAGVLEEINTFQLHIKGKLGTDPGLSEIEVPTAWEGISFSYEANKATQKEVLKLAIDLQKHMKLVKDVVTKMELLTIGSPSVTKHDLQSLANNCTSQLKVFHGQVSTTLNGTIGPLLQDLGTRLTALEVPGGGSTPAPTKALVEMERRWNIIIKQIEAKIDAKAVTMGGIIFRSLQDCISFATTSVPADNFQWFPDIVTYLQFVGGEVVDQSASEQSELHSARTKRTEEQSTFVAAFKTDIPQVLGGPVGARIKFENKHPLGALKNNAMWDSGDGLSGVRPQIAMSLDNQKSKLSMAAETALGGHHKALQVALAMINASHNFWESLSNFIDRFYRQLLTNAYGSSATASGEEECWKLIMTMVRTMFRALRKERVIAESAHSMVDVNQRVGLYLWASLQAHRVMKEYRDAAFKNHPEVSPSVTFFLFEHRAPTAWVKTLQQDHQALKKKHEELQKDYKHLRSEVDSLNTWKRSKK